jgi:hypothetical protein
MKRYLLFLAFFLSGVGHSAFQERLLMDVNVLNLPYGSWSSLFMASGPAIPERLFRVELTGPQCAPTQITVMEYQSGTSTFFMAANRGNGYFEAEAPITLFRFHFFQNMFPTTHCRFRLFGVSEGVTPYPEPEPQPQPEPGPIPPVP